MAVVTTPPVVALPWSRNPLVEEERAVPPHTPARERVSRGQGWPLAVRGRRPGCGEVSTHMLCLSREPSMPCVTAPTCTAGGWCWSGPTRR